MFHNKVISYEEFINNPPKRSYFIDEKTTPAFNKPLLFLPTYLYEDHHYNINTKNTEYKIILTGIIKNGSRINVIIHNADVYFEVYVPDNEHIETFIDKINNLLDKQPYRIDKNVYAKKFKYYRKDECRFIRLYFHKLKDRKNALNVLHKNNYETTTNDLNNYYRVICRDHLTTFSSWALLKRYTIEEDNKYVKGLTFNVDITDYKKYDEPLTSDLLKDKTLSLCWDIETWTPNAGDIPMPENKEDRIFCLSMTYQWVNENEPFLKICFNQFPSTPHKEFLTVICKDEKTIIKAFGKSFEHMRPEFIFGFNDSDYDWKWLIERAKSHKILSSLAENLDSSKPYIKYTDENLMKYNYKHEKIKIDAETYADSKTLMMHGYIPVDVRTIFRKLYPTAEQSSLKWFLSKNKLGGKEDMPYERLFRIYEDFLNNTTFNNKLLEEMNEVNYYCVIDAQRCHELIKIRSVIMDHREVSDFSYVSLYDAFYRANGVKVRNLTISTGQKRPFNIRFSNISNQNIEEGKYPGAFVFPPEKGLKVTKLSIEERIRKAELTKNTDHPVYQEWLNVDKDTIGLYYDYIEQNGPKIQSGINNDLYSDKHFREFLEEKIGRPITGLDFSSLYPSIIRTYNLSPEYCIPDTKEGRKLAREIKNSGQKITIVKFEFNGREIKGYFIWHNNKINITDEGFQFGVFPYILNDLFNRRAIIKKQMKEYDHKKEEMEKIEENKPGYLLEYKDQYEDIIFNKTYLNSKQNALKVFMNTFYGEAGNKISPFFLLEVAGGVTSLGQRNIKFAYNQVTEKGCHVYYGDTDSIYLSVPEKTFYEVDKLFYTNKISKLEYWTQLVELTFKIIKPINKEVNDAFLIDNGTAFLTMAYEEVLFPVAFTAKKKYYGIPHENIVNFKPKDLFIRGLDVKKRGVSELLRKVFTEIMWSSMTHDNLYDLMELVFQKIDMIYNTKWSLSDFTKSDVFRPKKANVKIQTFVKRMAEQNIYVKPGERFSYVIAKKYPYSYDFRGRKVELKIGDKMELLSVAEENKLEIDLDYYMQSSIKGQFARLITYHDSFQVKPIDQTDAELKIAEYKTYDNACKFIDNYCKKYYSKYNTFGKVNQKIFREANSLVGARIKQSDKLCYTLLSANVDLETFGDWLNEYTDKKAEKMTEDYGEYIIKEMLKGLSKEDKIKKISILQKVYYGNGPKSLSINRKLAFDKEQLSLNSKLHHLMNDIHKLYNIYHKSVGQIIQIMKKNITIDQSLFEPTDKEKDYKVDDLDLEYDLDLVKINADKCSNDIIKNEEFIELLNKLKSLYLEYLSNKVYYKRTESMVVYLKKLRDKRFGIINIPIDIKNIINNDVKNMSECDIVIKQ